MSKISGQISKLSILLVLVFASCFAWAQEDPRGEWFGEQHYSL
ncbi:MAG: hypothetical protein ACI959_001442 [Limisphaerales bacterium]|jgi:hypothetical protein